MAIAAIALLALGGDQLRGRGDRQLRATVTASEPDSVAVSAYRRGMSRVQQRTQRTLTEGLALIDESLRRDSTYALAWAGRAHALNWARQWGFEIPGVSSDSLLTLALQASERALDLDSTDANIWLVSAVMSRAVDPSRRDLSQRAVRRALALDSVNAAAWMQLGLDYQDLGFMDSARTSMRRAFSVPMISPR